MSERGEYSLQAGATLHCDTDDSQFTVLGSLIVESSSQQRPIKGDGSDDGLPAVSINLPLACQGNLTLLGPSTTVLHRSSSIHHITSQSSPTLTLQPTAATASYTFHQPVRLSSSGSRLILQSAHNVSLLSAFPSEIDILELRDGRLQTNAGLRFAELHIGTTISPGVLESEGTVDVDKLVMVAGSMQSKVLRVSGGMVIHHSAAKHLDVRNLTLLPLSVSRIQPTLLSLSSTTTIVLQPAATLTLSPSVTLYTANATGDDGSQRTAQLYIEGSLVCAGSGHGTTSLLIDVTHSGSLTINNSAQAGQYSIHTASWTSTLNSSIIVGANSLLLLACPAQYSATGCRYGPLGGGGAVSVQSGSHVFLSSLSLRALWIDGGTARFLAWLSLDHVRVSQGELILHSLLNTSTLLWSGGTVRGYPLLSSAVQLLPDGSASLASNSTLTLDGVALLLHSPLRWTGGDLMLRNEALLRVELGGTAEIWNDGNRVVMVVSDGSSARLESAGSVVVHTPLTLHVPFINSGKLRLLNSSDLMMHVDYVQSGERSSLRVEEGCRLWKTSGDMMVAQGSVGVVSGSVHGNLEMGGELIVGESGAEALVDGDVILSPSASIHIRCHPTRCRPLTINGTLYANGRLMTDAESADATYHVFNAIAVQNDFIRQPQQRISSTRGKIELHVTAPFLPDNIPTPPIPAPSPLYLPFLPVSDYLSAAALAQQTANVSCVSQLQAREAAGVLGMSRRSLAAVLVALICVSSTMALVLLGAVWWWWTERTSVHGQRRQQERENGVRSERVRCDEANEVVERSAGVVDVRQQQLQTTLDVHYM